MSFLDNDFYNFTMSMWAHMYRDVEIEYKFINRSKQKLKPRVPSGKITDALAEMKERMQPTDEDIEYLKSLGIFSSIWLNAVRHIELPEVQFEWGDDEYEISYRGPWWSAMFMETPLLAAVNQAWNNFNPGGAMGNDLLNAKIDFLRQHPYLNFIEFGTRRRASATWQEFVLEKMLEKRPYQLKGTSNVYLAKKYGLQPVGTMAHQLFMVESAYTNPEASTAYILHTWQELYGGRWNGRLLTALTDTFGTDMFLRIFMSVATSWNGARQDSGDPVAWAHKMLRTWHEVGVDPRNKVMTFSDGLDPQKMLDIWGQVGTLTIPVFGWGTNLTNDVGFTNLSLVAKPVRVYTRDGNHFECVKLSDDISKATGDPEEIEKIKALVKYDCNFSGKVVY